MKKVFIAIMLALWAANAFAAGGICRRSVQWTCGGQRGAGSPTTAGNTSGWTCWCKYDGKTWVPVDDDYDTDSGTGDGPTCGRICPGRCNL